MTEKQRPFQRRTGISGLTRWRGVVKEGRAAAIGSDRLRDGINVRLQGDEIANRGGQEKVNTTAVDECIVGIWDAQSEETTAGKLWLAGGLNTGAINFILSSYHPDNSPAFQSVVGHASATGGIPLFVREDTLHFGIEQNIFQLVPIKPPIGDDVLEAGGFTHVERFILSDPRSAITDLLTGITYVSGHDNSGDGGVFSWDGTTLENDSGAQFGTDRPIMMSYHEDTFAVSTHLLKKRNGGTWDTIAMPGSLTAFVPNDWAVFEDVLYIAGHDNTGPSAKVTKLLSYDGTTLAVARTPSASSGDGDGVVTVAVAFDLLYYAWVESNTNNLFLGTYDGSTWTDSHKDMSAAGVGTDVITATDSLLYRGDLFMIVERAAPESDVALVRSPASATSGTWVEVQGDLGTGEELLIF